MSLQLTPKLPAKSWTLALRSWPENDGGSGAFLSKLAKKHGARLRLLPLQPQHDGPLLRTYLAASMATRRAMNWSTRVRCRCAKLVGEAGRGELMIAMRLHALIFAASQGVPCIAINYDPKVRALAEIIGAPCLENLHDAGGVGKSGWHRQRARLEHAKARQELADLARLDGADGAGVSEKLLK